MAAADGKQSFARRDFLQQIEADVQKKWSETKIFETDAPSEKGDKFMVTFPYPYMNGLLHIGHAFTLSKAIFAAHFNRLLGKKVLFPFGFHCTGMPIQAAANKLKREYEVYGSPHPIFPAGRPSPKEGAPGVIDIDADGVTLLFKPPSSTGQKPIKCHHLLMKVGGGDFEEVAAFPHPSPEALKSEKGKVVHKAPVDSDARVFKVRTELADGSMCPDSKESDQISADAAPKEKKGSNPAAGGGKRVAKKILAKTGDAAFQWEILRAMGLEPEDMPPFTDPIHWLQYFPPLGARDLKLFGAPIDFRRSFITTSVNPYYDSFIRWQFRKLKAADKIGFGKRPTIYSEADKQACMDHDRDEGEGVAPQEYVAIKVEVLELPSVMKSLKGKRVFLLAATLRPETMPGQTNCWIKPEGTYGCYKANDKEVYVCSHRAARNMSFQDILTPWGKPECLLEVTGKDIMGTKVHAPTSKYEAVYLLPLLTIKMDKGTGVVTSVPSDSPDDYAAFMDLMKPGKREFFGLKTEWVEPFELIPIIDVEIDGEMQTLAAKYMCEKLGVQSQKDSEKLQEAHDVCYKLGFDKGVMSYGPFKGELVKKAKPLFRAQMIKDGQAFLYSEPEKRVTSRSGDECVVALIDQWYLKYGEEAWQAQIEGHVSGSFNAYNERNKELLVEAINWLKEWACSRSFGLGTRVPWDEQFLIESLSDSTIYMAYYTVAHFLQGDLNGSTPGSAGIQPSDLTDAVWDFVYLGGPLPSDSKVPKATLDKMRQEFRFWYPLDLRVSGKDLIQNHLTMALYNHACIWEQEPEMWPRGYFCNGWLLVNNEKMSKSKGNFFTMSEIMKKYTVDTVRLALADSGDTLEPANFNETVANKALLAFPVFLDTLKAMVGGSEPLDASGEGSRFVDRWFANEMNRLVLESRSNYENMYYREALRTAYFEFTTAFDQYRDVCRAAKSLPSKTLAMRYFEWQLIILSPISPHFCDHAWAALGKSGSVLDARFPEPTAPVDTTISIQGTYMYDKVPHEFIKLLEKASKSGRPTAATVYVARSFPEWKVSVLALLRQKQKEGLLPLVAQEEMKNDETAKAQWKDIMQALMQDPAMKPFGKHLGPFAAFKRDEAAAFGLSALEASVPFDELGLVTEHAEYLRAKLKADVTVLPSEQPAAPDHAEAAGNAQPGKPGVHYAGAQNGGAPAGKPAGKPAGGGKAAGGGGAAAKAKTISDVKQLDSHFSTRSYFEDGPGPSAADAAQFAVTPANIDTEKFPHAARWYRHIGSFTAAQRARW